MIGETRVCQLRVTLRDVEPLIWRVIQVTGNTTIYKLHLIVQAVMGWDNYHLFMFTIDGIEYGEPSPDDFRPVKSARRAKLFQVIRQARQRFLYEYDFGDGWGHDIKVEKVLDPTADTRYPICLAGQRACPPEDCGGPWGYEELLSVIRNPKHEEHESTMEWLGGEFDPEEFDLEGVNQALKSIR